MQTGLAIVRREINSCIYFNDDWSHSGAVSTLTGSICIVIDEY